MRTNAIPANIYRHFLSVKAAPKQANAVAKDEHFNSTGSDFNILATILHMAININKMFRMVFISADYKKRYAILHN